MLVTFKTDVGNIPMFGEVALQIIKMMGHSETIPGAILTEDLPGALARLKAAVAKEKNPQPIDDNEGDDDKEPAVSLAHRAAPLIDLMTAAVEAESDLMWE